MARSIARATAISACAAAITAPVASAAAPPGPPPLPARAAALLEETTGQQLFGDNADAELPIASTTKLMTALVTLRHARFEHGVRGSRLLPRIRGLPDRAGARGADERHDLVVALLLPSADDAAEDLAYNVGHGSVGRFEGMMNARARELGLAQTHYTTPSGLERPATLRAPTT